MTFYTVSDLALNTTPASPATGAVWLVGPTPSGDWDTDDAENMLAGWDGSAWGYQPLYYGDVVFASGGTYAGQHVTILEEGGYNTPSTDAAVTTQVRFLGGARVLEFEEDEQPASPAVGDAYITASSIASGDTWLPNQLVEWTGDGWDQYPFAAGMRVQVARSATHAFKGAELSYNSSESLWFPLQPLSIASEHWTGRYSLTGTNEKIYSKTLTGDLLDHTAASITPGPAHEIAHGVTLDQTTRACKAEVLVTKSTSSLTGPTLVSGIAFETSITATNVVLSYPDVNLSTYDYTIRMEYTK